MSVIVDRKIWLIDSPFSKQDAITMEKQLLTDKELAPILGCSWRHIKTLRLKRLIPFVQLGRLVRYNPQEVMKALEKITIKEHDRKRG
jgi:excisionase family DNA binding protein